MVVHALPRSGFGEVTWASGRARAFDIATAADPAGRLLWRVALAEIPEPLPFSPFAGLERVFTVVAGGGVSLIFPDRRVEIAPDRPFRFDGDGPAPDCRPATPGVLAFNIMAAKGAIRAEASILSGTVALAAGPREEIVVLALDAPAPGDFALAAGDGARIDPGTRVKWRTEGRLAVARMSAT